MMKNKSKFAASVVFGLALLVMAMFALWMQPDVEMVEAGPWPTPQPFAFGGGEWVMVPYINAQTIITGADQTYCGTEFQTAAYVLADVQTVYSEGVANMITLTMQFSNDSENWCVPPVSPTQNIVHGLLTDTVDCETVPLFGRYSRVCATSNSGEMFTLTVRAKLYN